MPREWQQRMYAKRASYMVTDHTELMAAAARAQNLNVEVSDGPTTTGCS